MPTLSKERKTKEIELPKSGGKVVIYESVKTGDLDKLDVQSREDLSSSAMASVMIKEWNFTDEDGNGLEPNQENIKLLDLPDFAAIMREADMEDFLDQENQPTEK